MGPVEVMVVSYPDAGTMTGIAPLLEQLTAGGTLHIVDALIVTGSPDGSVTVTDLEDDVMPGWSTISPQQRPLLSGSDAALVVEELGHTGVALVVAIEHAWADSIANIVEDSGGVLQLHVRVSPEVVAAASLVDS